MERVLATLMAQGYLSLNLEPSGASPSPWQELFSLGGELWISRRISLTGGCGFGVAMPAEAPTGAPCRAQHDTPRLVLMNTPSCHRAPPVPESTSLCLLTHYLMLLQQGGAWCETLLGVRRVQIWMEAVSWATKVPALKGNGPTHRLTDLKG